MRLFLAGSLMAVLLFCAGVTKSFSHETQNGATSNISSPEYPDTPAALKGFVEDILTAYRSKDNSKMSAYTSKLLMPDDGAWFVRAFDPNEGSRLEARYKQLLPEEAALIQKTFRFAASGKRVDIKVAVLEKNVGSDRGLYADIEEAMAQAAPLYYVEGQNPKEKFPVYIGLFVHVDGGFRYLDDEVFQALSTARPMRIRIAGNVTQAKIVRKVSPIYPDAAKAAHVAGSVVLHVVIGIDGAVKEVAVVSGDAALSQAALDAVRQWVYQPTLLNGKPVEVDSTVTVEFRP